MTTNPMTDPCVEAVARAIAPHLRSTLSTTNPDCDDQWQGYEQAAYVAGLAIAAMHSSRPVEDGLAIDAEHLARQLSIPEHHTTWDRLDEIEKSRFHLQAEYAIAYLSTLTTQASELSALKGEIELLGGAINEARVHLSDLTDKGLGSVDCADRVLRQALTPEKGK